MVASAVQVCEKALLATMRGVAVTLSMVLTCTLEVLDRDVVTNFTIPAVRNPQTNLEATLHSSSS